MIYKYNKWQQDDPLNTEHQETILSTETLVYQLIFAEVFHSNEGSPTPVPV